MFGPRPRWTASEIQSIASGSRVRAWASGPASTTSKPSALTSSPAVVFAAASSPHTNIVARAVERLDHPGAFRPPCDCLGPRGGVAHAEAREVGLERVGAVDHDSPGEVARLTDGGFRGVERRREDDHLAEARRLGDAARPRLRAGRANQGRHLGAPRLAGAEHHVVAGGGPALAERGADVARADDPDSHLVSHMTAGLNRSARTP